MLFGASFHAVKCLSLGTLLLAVPAFVHGHDVDSFDFTVAVKRQNRHYDVVALEVPIVYNVYGDHDPNGLMFALKENEDALERYAHSFVSPDPLIPSAKAPRVELNPLVRPLVLRCNLHDTVTIVLENKIRKHPVGMHVALDGHDVKSDGSAVGRNPPSLAPPGGKYTYHWKCSHQGVFHIGDAGNLGGTENDTNLHGLFGALIVEPYGSRWTDPHTGEPIRDGLTADIHPPKPPGFENFKANFFDEEPELHHPTASFREHVTIFHDEPEIRFGRTLTESPCGPNKFVTNHAQINAKEEDAVHAINYRSEPLRNRQSDVFDRIKAGTLEVPVYGEEQHHSSWMHGDPGLVFFNYAGDPVKFRVVHGGVRETHVFHWHVHQWYAVDGKVDSPIIDSFSLSPQWATTFTALYGAGSRLKSIGDAIFHCHLYPHFTLGMWGIFRTFDTLQDGSLTYPNGKQILPLRVLPDRQAPPNPTLDRPGFPNFIAGKIHQKSPRVPWPTEMWGPIPEGSDFRPATEKEVNAMNRDPQPGSTFTLIPTPRQNFVDRGIPVREVARNISALNRNILFNRFGWHDPSGHLYQLEEEEFGDRNTPTPYDPFIMRSNKGDVLRNTLKNKFDTFIPGNAFDPPFPDCPAHPTEGEVGIHVHLVKFDVLVSDGASVGWNYLSGPRFGKFLIHRWWADEEFGHVFFHDHLFANFRQKKGLYALNLVQPFATWFANDNLNRPIVTGVQAAIKTREGDWYREVVQFVADFHPAFNRHGLPLNPPNFPGSDQDQGIMLVNYKSEPLRERIKEFRRKNNGRDPDPSILFSSDPFGDPSTTVYQSYPNDTIRLRIGQGSHEESHSFNAYGLRWHDLFTDPNSRLVQQQILGISKAFTKIVEPVYSPGDHMLYWRAIDDTWLGCWSLLRVHDKEVPNLPTLPSNPRPFAKQLPSQQKPDPKKHREYRVVAESRRIDYTEGFLGQNRIDPFGLIYRLEAYKEPGTTKWIEVKTDKDKNPEPLVIRAIEGEWITVWLTNNINPDLKAEPNRPEVPVDLRSYREVSPRVSIHADIVLFDTRVNDGTNVGKNGDQTVANGETRAFTWFADQFYGSPILLQDQADFRNHRHHGLIGALLVEKEGWIPSTWYGAEATLTRTFDAPQFHDQDLRFQATGGAMGFHPSLEDDEIFEMDEHVVMLQDVQLPIF
ncbi:uncharacterized protein SPPG_09220 [Spizellomyces punctatus DAOM BR117]|uniref:Plastocyanin-like domain-containing protein n=1 Tax=Spizellomyces punctatus (strain DAOM BR117) TaxID=645134 RepID=A0A0L0HHU1_SPIPD|nr:uncharacterized protein SPPG_09220 [Spizellomyces punctatus DAOM BR117]KND00430.1 hypothetical protein SPPG_09220 [Spizellomyces punctatus DAOM BR117]|eukprot:XP_016608469.1 hypothetical protein SPPG_09220 [Spizellomyces punctatus DAOM BR117]